jgi:sulfatase maturation enzyme AslB (radical SAM superfamily)
MNYASFHENENNLLETFLFASFDEIKNTRHFTSSVFEHLELIITPECNQKCEYCYITK